MAEEVQTGRRCEFNGEETTFTVMIIMSTSVKALRPGRLSEDETLTSFEDWKNNLIFYLNQDKTFAPFLKANAKWKKSSDSESNRGLADEDATRVYCVILLLRMPRTHRGM